MRLAFLAIPNEYGLYTVYRNLRSGLLRHGIELRWVGTGEGAVASVKDPQWKDHLAWGEVVEMGPRSDTQRAGMAIIRHIEGNYQGVIVSPPYDGIEMNTLRFLRPDILRVLTVQSMAFGIYRITKPLRHYVHFTIGASPRVADDLVRFAKFPKDRTLAAPNGIDPTPFAGVRRQPAGGPVRLLYLGKMIDAQKGVFWLPEILAAAGNADVTLTLAGDGQDLAELKRRCAPFGPRVTFLGRVPSAEVPRLLGEHHALMLTSRSEGLPSVLIEAMAAGCVPVASSIRGLTDFVVTHGRTGMLFPMGDVRAAGNIVRGFAEDRAELARLSDGAVAEFQARFTDAAMGDRYAEVIRKAAATPLPRPPLPVSDWHMPREFRPSLVNRFMPRAMKNMIQRWLG